MLEAAEWLPREPETVATGVSGLLETAAAGLPDLLETVAADLSITQCTLECTLRQDLL